ncbi:MAG: TIM44-like domain-containing protein [Methylomonas sp.]|jgi:hypothetical protein
MIMRILSWLLLAVNLCWLPTAAARFGGGHSSSSIGGGFSHGGSGFSGGGGGFGGGSFYGGGYSGGGQSSMSSGEALLLFILAICLIAFYVWYNYYREEPPVYVAAPTLSNLETFRSDYLGQLALLKQADANFSGILFLEFVHSLYTKFYMYATHPEFSYLSPFLSSALQQHFLQAPAWTISEVVVNGIRWQAVNTAGGDSDSISVDIDSNYTLQLQGKRSRYAVEERWRFFRDKGVLSAEPEKMHSLCCPHCGAPAHFTDAGVCGHCGGEVQKGGMQWCLGQRVVLKTEALGMADLVAYAEEEGTDLPTVRQPDLAAAMQSFVSLHKLADWNAFWQPFVKDVASAYFLTIYTQWSKRDWQAVRHLLSDRIYEANSFWMDLYTANNWVNRLDNISIQRIEPVKLEVDKFYEALTVRIFASCNDYTEDAAGKVLGGSKRDLRRYSEYWTFVRRTGLEQHTGPYSLTQCPQCGAPADNMGQTAECGYCGSKISTGNFSWVVFLITQDEVYAG